MNQRDLIIRALEKRGEKRVEDRTLSKYEKWTRTYNIRRGPEGQLLRVQTSHGPQFYFIGKAGALRAGFTSTGSVTLQGALRNALIVEGRE